MIRGCSRADPRPRCSPASALQVPLVVGQQEAGVLLGAPYRSAPARARRYGVQSRSESKQDLPPHGVHLLCGSRHPSVSGHGEATRPAHTRLGQGQVWSPPSGPLEIFTGGGPGDPFESKAYTVHGCSRMPDSHRPAMGTWVRSLKTEPQSFSCIWRRPSTC